MIIGEDKAANWMGQKAPFELLEAESDHDIAINALSYQTHISYQVEDPGWDAFLQTIPGSHHVQTSLWAQVKAELGWRAVRILATQGECIVAGAQLLIRPMTRAGAIGYVPKGPVFAFGDPALVKLVLDKLQEVAKTHHIQYLAVQPLRSDGELIQQLPHRGFQTSPHEIAPTATVMIDLTQDLNVIMQQMKRGIRYNIRHGLREGVKVREGTENDLSAFYRIFVATSQRQKFSVYPEGYYHRMWQVLQPRGWIRLFLAEWQDELVSSQLAIVFNDTVIRKLSAWAGTHGDCKPNEVLEWEVIQWAKSHGYRYYDFEGINRKLAEKLLRGEPVSEDQQQTVYSFKLGFGGKIKLFPCAYSHIYNPLLRSAFNSFLSITNQGIMRSIARFLVHNVRMN